MEKAREIDAKNAGAWLGHPYFDVIDNSSDFETKIRRLIAVGNIFTMTCVTLFSWPLFVSYSWKRAVEISDAVWCRKIRAIKRYSPLSYHFTLGERGSWSLSRIQGQFPKWNFTWIIFTLILLSRMDKVPNSWNYFLVDSPCFFFFQKFKMFSWLM